jgi:excisionase family DNA binding protein
MVSCGWRSVIVPAGESLPFNLDAKHAGRYKIGNEPGDDTMDLRAIGEKAVQYGIQMPSADREKTLTPKQVAKIMGVTTEAVKVWIYRNKLPAIKLVNGYWQIKVTDFERFIERRQHLRQRVFVEGSAAVQDTVTKLGFDVFVATNIADAQLKLASSAANLLVLDTASKRIPTFALLTLKKKLKAAKHVPALLIGTIPDAEITRAAELDVKSIVSSADDIGAEVTRLLSVG